ncbi:YlbL family protein [Zafaria sp. J156]|uniref:YlbL family protein n=1 Tax=Zafaria sp. J156 TaxID=3116490 RepID=UPI002E7A1596|nr:S16 family serine protease [Zafaria sp. J156]MEE1620345.1 S16 family serine protease [Zafaria sp. J156]
MTQHQLGGPADPADAGGPAGAGGSHRPAADAVRRTRIQRALIGSTAVALVTGFGAMALPSPFVVESPGPAINTVGIVDGEPVIRVSGRESFQPEGPLDLTTVYVRGGADRRIPFFQVLQGWVDPAQDVYPEETVYPRGTTDEQITEQNTAQMDSSQQTSVAAALGSLGIEYGQTISVAELATATNAGILQQGDVLRTVNGERIADATMLRERLQDAGDAPSMLGLERDGEELEVEVVTAASPEGQRLLGVFLDTAYDFPFDVDFTLTNVGGPSAGLMFSLGLIDTLTPGELAGGRHVAGTGTIDAAGAVGPIGGIAQKLVGARDNGAELFLAPAGNCEEVLGRIPDGLSVVKVETLDDARAALEHVAAGEDPASLPACG